MGGGGGWGVGGGVIMVISLVITNILASVFPFGNWWHRGSDNRG